MNDKELRHAGIHEDSIGAARGFLFVLAVWGIFALGAGIGWLLQR